MLKKKLVNGEEFTSRLILQRNYYDNQGECTSFRVVITGDDTALGRLFTRIFGELARLIGSKEFRLTQLASVTRWNVTSDTDTTSNECKDSSTTAPKP